MDLSNSSTSLTRTAMTVGAATGALMIFISMFPNQLTQYICLAVFIGGIQYGIKYFRTLQGGHITFGKAWITGIRTAFFASVILAFMIYITAKVIDPSIINVMITQFETTVRSADLPSGMADLYVREMNQKMSPAFLGLATILSYTFIGTIIACVGAFFLKNTGNNITNPNTTP